MSKKKVEKKVERLWKARDAPPQGIHRKSENIEVWGETSRASRSSHSLPYLYYILVVRR
jgi:hypothetical protein